MAFLKIYTGNVTAGAKDGTEVSSERTLTNPIVALLDSTIEEQQAFLCAVRCDTGYKTNGPTILCFMYWNGSAYQATGGAMSKFKVARDNNYTPANVIANASWQDSITINEDIEDENVLFWIKVSTTRDEPPVKDNTISITAKGIVMTVEEE